MKIVEQIGNRTVYVATIGGREVRATTVNGAAGAERIFAAIRSQNGIAKSAPMPIALPATERR
jgi:hypothetical protein